MKAYTIEAQSAQEEEFASAREQFEGLVDQLCSEPVMKHFEHGEVETLVEQEGREVLRRLLQGYLDLRAAEEPRRESVSGADGVARRHCRERERELMTLFGPVRVRRKGYSAHGLPSVFLLDEALNLAPDKYSHGLRRRVGEEVASGAFEEAADAIERGTGGKVPKRQAEQLTHRLSRDFDAYYRQTDDDADEENAKDLLVMSVDGKGIVMREQDLREATRKAAERGRHKLKTRLLSRGEKRNRKRMATVATLYGMSAAQPREAEQILGQTGQETKDKRPKPYHKRVWASVQKEPLEVIEQLFEAALRRDPRKKRRWLMLVDGDERQLRAIKSCIERYQADVVIVQDFIHVLEYLWKAAYCFHPEGSEAAEKWVMDRARMLLESRASDAAAGMRRSATRRGLSQKERGPVEKCAEYVLKNKERLDYASALAEGWPIATGVIEGACRYLVKDRMELTGARWSLEGAEAVLCLRSLHASGDLDDYMGFHIAQERQRNYRTPTGGGAYASALAA